jgi:hypothetical protein
MTYTIVLGFATSLLEGMGKYLNLSKRRLGDEHSRNPQRIAETHTRGA